MFVVKMSVPAPDISFKTCVCRFRILFQPPSRHGFVMCLSVSGRRNRSWSDTICIPDVMPSCIEGAGV